MSLAERVREEIKMQLKEIGGKGVEVCLVSDEEEKVDSQVTIIGKEEIKGKIEGKKG